MGKKDKLLKRNNIMDYLEYKGYKGSVEYSKEDDCLCGKVIGMNKDLILYEGTTLSELRQDFENAVDDYLAGCIADGVEPRKPFSGKMIVRMSSGLHERIAIAANNNGYSINDYIVRLLEEETPQYSNN